MLIRAHPGVAWAAIVAPTFDRRPCVLPPTAVPQAKLPTYQHGVVDNIVDNAVARTAEVHLARHHKNAYKSL
jgi:hypothetical protein